MNATLATTTETETQTAGREAPPLDEPWFAEGDRRSSPPPSTRSQRLSSLPPAEPIGDSLADDWFR